MKKILLALCGMTPQIITETLYALRHEGRMVDAVRVLTTREGKAACHAHLLVPRDGYYYRFLRDYGIDDTAIDFGWQHVRAVVDEDGHEIDDINTEEENELFLRACMEATFELTSDPDTAVFFSIAGGRKTMGACLSLAAQFYGRPQDRIFHVLVSPEFESCRDFYYPPPVSQSVVLYDKDRQPYSKETRYARVTLVPVPFVSVRNRISEKMLKAVHGPAVLMLSLVREKRPELVINLLDGTINWKGVERDMMPARLALYAFFARRKVEYACARTSCRGCDECFLTAPDIIGNKENMNRISRLYEMVCADGYGSDAGNRAERDLGKEGFNSYRSKINADLKKGFGPYELKHLEIAAGGRKPNKRYGLSLDRERIKVVGREDGSVQDNRR